MPGDKLPQRRTDSATTRPEDTPDDLVMRIERTRIHLARLPAITRHRAAVQVRVSPDTLSTDAVVAAEALEQLNQRRDLFVGKRIDAIAIVDQFDGNRSLAVAKHMVRHLILGHARAQRAVAVDHVVNAQPRMRVDVAQLGVYGDIARVSASDMRAQRRLGMVEKSSSKRVAQACKAVTGRPTPPRRA